MNKSAELYSIGQSIWYDNIQRSLLTSGQLEEWIHDGKIYGVTSNPTIFNNAIGKSSDYDSAIQTMSWAGWSSSQIFDQLAKEDIQTAASLFLPLYQATKHKDGFVSIEVNPLLARDTAGTINEAKRLWTEINHPNLMIKIPATVEGLPAITEVIAEGINVNVTLIFSLKRYEEVIDAYLKGLEARAAKNLPIDQIASVASFFVSRVDSKIDQIFKNNPDSSVGKQLSGKAAITNARLAYAIYMKHVTSKRFASLADLGVTFQRPLWASTSTKSPAYRDVVYVEELIGKSTVNTVPPQTLTALLDHANIDIRISNGLDKAHHFFDELLKAGADIDQVTDELEIEGVASFIEAYQTCLATIDKRKAEFAAQAGTLLAETQARVSLLRDSAFIQRMFEQDASLWTNDPEGLVEIKKRLGWLYLPQTSRQFVAEINAFRQQIISAGYTSIVLLGMGGSSLAPELYNLIFNQNASIKMHVLDSTDPDQVRSIAKKVHPSETLFIVSSKSGGTAEINAFLDYFWKITKRACAGKAGEHFVAITDPGTSLEKTALSRNFRKIFLADPSVGGRYSALTIFGLLPAGIIGVDLNKLLDSATSMSEICKPGVPAERNPGLVLGAFLGQAALANKDKLTIIAEKGMEPFGDWMEQLIAESSGKQGRGIVPVVGEKILKTDVFGDDRVFVYIRSVGGYDTRVKQLQKAGHPVLVFQIADLHHLGGEFYRWEIAVAVACAVIRVNAFDQPDVQDNKSRTLAKIEEYRKTGALAEPTRIVLQDCLQVIPSEKIYLQEASNTQELFEKFIASTQKGDYIAITAYLPYDRNSKKALAELREYLKKASGLAVTTGFGPRFLHSTGQIHKGGANNGVFLQITADPGKDLKYGDLTFGTLERAQALGDFESLTARGRRILRIHLSHNGISDMVRNLKG